MLEFRSSLTYKTFQRALEGSKAHTPYQAYKLGVSTLCNVIGDSTNAEEAIKRLSELTFLGEKQVTNVEEFRPSLEAFYGSLSGISSGLIINLVRVDNPSRLDEEIKKNRQHLLSPLVISTAQKTALEILNQCQFYLTVVEVILAGVLGGGGATTEIFL